MDDTQQPIQPDPQPDPAQQPVSFTPVVLPATKNKLEELSIDIKADLDYYLKRGMTLNKVKNLLEKKHLGKTDILPAHYTTYKAYFELHKPRLLEERTAENKDLQQTTEDLRELGKMTEEIAEGHDVELRNKYQDLLDYIEDRIATVEAQQTGGFASAQYEMVIVHQVKMKKEILERLEKFKTELDQKRHEADLSYFERFASELDFAVYNIVKQLYGLDRFEEFRSLLKAKIPEIVKRAQESYDTNYKNNL